MKDYLVENDEYLDKIYPHTEYKIKYIKSYVKMWLEVAANYKGTKNINFIDCMCNAGIYKNNILGTSTEILKLFVEFAPNFPHIKFNLFVNDIDDNRINIIKYVFMNYTDYQNIKNINIYFSNKDVNEYLDEITKLKNMFDYNAQAFTILFVDPYRFGDVKIMSLNKFLSNYRSELIYNYFISDYRRNINNSYAENKQQMMIESMNGVEGYNRNMDANQVLALLQSNFKKTKIQYIFAYPFHITNNAQLYYIIYGTPHFKGLKKSKNVFGMFSMGIQIIEQKKKILKCHCLQAIFKKEAMSIIIVKKLKKELLMNLKVLKKNIKK